MPDGISASMLQRAVLTDTLPYEVPVIFSNDKFHSALSAKMPDAVREQWNKLGIIGNGWAVPYNYDIAKDDLRYTSLSIVHPRIQVLLASFYERHSSSILSHCADERMSLRRPVNLASPFIASTSPDENGRLKLGVAQLVVDEGQPDVSHLPSYFAYGKYNLLGKFIGSREFTRLEGRYLRYRTLDVTKCFYNIYSHTISWAVKEKRLAKNNTNSYSFEGEFDKLMQLSNYNETNGIVVGPEISRVFAEIILQDIDDKIIKRLLVDNLQFGRDYDIRRYVDDYFVFSNAVDTLDVIEAAIRTELAAYKLYVNERKTDTAIRPFASNLSIARQDVGALLRDASHALRELSVASEPIAARRHYRRIKGLLSEIRLIVSKYDISFANISGWVMTRLKQIIRKAFYALDNDTTDFLKPLIGEAIIFALEQAFYLCSIDLRVRSTYSIAQICLIIEDKKSLLSDEQYDTLQHIIMDNCLAILRAYRYRTADKFGMKDSVEAFNLLIVGSLFVKDDFLKSSDVKETLNAFMRHGTITYFAYISLKFCFLRDLLTFGPEIKALNDLAIARVTAKGVDFHRDTEEFLLLQDLLSCPDLTAKEKRDIVNKALDTDKFGHKGIELLAPWTGYVDWSGLSVHHLLAKKGLRPVYAWG